MKRIKRMNVEGIVRWFLSAKVGTRVGLIPILGYHKDGSIKPCDKSPIRSRVIKIEYDNEQRQCKITISGCELYPAIFKRSSSLQKVVGMAVVSRGRALYVYDLRGKLQSTDKGQSVWIADMEVIFT